MIFKHITQLAKQDFSMEMSFPNPEYTQVVSASGVRYAILVDSSNLLLVSDTPFTATLSQGTQPSTTFRSIEKTVEGNPYIAAYEEFINVMLNINVTEAKAKDFFLDAPYYTVSIPNAMGLGDIPDDIETHGAPLFTIRPEDLALSGKLIGDGYLTRIDNRYRWIASDYGLEFLLAGGGDFRMKEAITHTVYLDGTAATIWIKTEHTVSVGYVETEWRLGVGSSAGNSWLPLYDKTEFEHFATTASDRPSLRSFSFPALHNSGMKNEMVTEYLSFMYPDILFQFQDNIWQSQTKQTYKSESLQIRPNNTYRLYPLSPFEANTIVKLVVVIGSPSDDDKANSSDGEAGDNSNYDGSDRYKDNDGDNPDDYERGSDEGSIGIFNDAYIVSNENMKSLKDKLWTQSYFDVLKVNQNPMDNILSVKRFPFQMESSAAKDIRIGNIQTGVNGNPLSKGIYEKDFHLIVPDGSQKFPGAYGNFIDLKMKASLFLPFIGFVPLEVSNFLYQKLSVKYLVDIMSGACKAIIYRNSKPVLEYDGTMGIDINLSASTQKQSDIAFYSRIASGGIGVGMGLMAGNPLSVLGGLETIANTDVKNSFQSTTAGGSISNAGYLEVFLVRIVPELTVVDGIYPVGYKESYGIPNMKTQMIRDLQGYIKVGGQVVINNFAATQAEKEEITALLSQGVVRKADE